MNTERRLVVKIRHGSHLYGLNTPESDTDYKAIVLPSEEDILMGNTHFIFNSSSGDMLTKNSADDVDYEVFSLHAFLDLCISGQMVALDMIHCKPEDIVAHDAIFIWNWLISCRELFYTKNLHAYVAYSQKQAAKYGIKGSRIKALEDALEAIDGAIVDYPPHTRLRVMLDDLPINEFSSIFVDEKGNTFYDIVGRKIQDTMTMKQAYIILDKIYDNYGVRARLAATNNGIDWKAISHALRAGYQARSIFKYGSFRYPLQETSYLAEVKAGKLDFVKQVEPVLEELVDEITVLAKKSQLPDFVDEVPFYKALMEHHRYVL